MGSGRRPDDLYPLTQQNVSENDIEEFSFDVNRWNLGWSMRHRFTVRHFAMMAALRDARQAAGISQRALSAKLHRPHNYINLIENGQRLPNFCEFLEITISIDKQPAPLVEQIMALTGLAAPRAPMQSIANIPGP